jgi:hypothetical protein
MNINVFKYNQTGSSVIFYQNKGMKKIIYGWIVIFIFLTSFTTYAQQDSASNKGKVQFKLGAYYNSHLNYYGRTDSLRSSGFFPMAELWINKSFYINAAPVFVNNKANSFEYAGTVATAGYLYSEPDKFIANIYLVKPIYKDNSQLVQAALKAQVGTTLTWLNKFINITGGGDVKFSDKTDYGLTAGVDHIFRLELDGPSILVIDPTANLNAGTQQFAKTYYKNSSFLLFPGAEQVITESVNNFNILSYEFSMPVIFAKGKMQFLFTPAYVLPQNLITVPNRPDLSERGKEMFYATLGAKVIF